MNTILVCVLALAQHHAAGLQPKDSDWAGVEGTLRQLAAREGIALMVDLPNEPPANVVPGGARGKWAMIGVAAFLDREWTTQDGVQLFSRRASDAASAHEDAYLDVLRALDGLSDDDLLKAMDDGLPIDQLAPRDQARLIARAFNWPGLVQTSAYDLPEQTFSALQDAGGTTRLTIAGMRRYVGGGREAYSYESVSARAQDPPVDPGPRPAQTYEPLALAPAGGQIDFGEGAVLTVEQVLRRVGDAALSYRIDSRILDDRLFVSGRYTRERLDACLARVLHLQQLKKVSMSEELRSLRSRLAERLLRLDPNSLPGMGERLTLQELQQRDPVAYGRLIKSGMPIGQPGVVVEPGFFLRLDPGARVSMGTRKQTLNGVEREVAVWRQISIGLGF